MMPAGLRIKIVAGEFMNSEFKSWIYLISNKCRVVLMHTIFFFFAFIHIELDQEASFMLDLERHLMKGTTSVTCDYLNIMDIG